MNWLLKSKKKIPIGNYVSVALAQGNHFDQVMNTFLANGWGVQYVHHNTAYNHDTFITFVSGANAKEVKLDLANAHIL